MPEVGFNQEPERYELKTAPPDGYVKLRRLPYNELLARREMATKLSMDQNPAKGRRAKEQAPQKIDIELIQLKSREFEFKHCVVDHNLTIGGMPVDFSQPKLAFAQVDPKILQEIELYLTELNQEADEDELEDFTTSPSPSSPEETTQLESYTGTDT